MSTIRVDLLSRATEIKAIPTLNTIITKIFNILSNRDSSFSDLNEVVKYDHAISSKVISIANSAYYSRGIEIYSLNRAMINIGFEEVKRIIMCLLFMENVLKQLKLREEDLFALWKHSVYVACASKLLSERTLAEDPQKAYTAGLLHDIGKVVFYMSQSNYADLLRQAAVHQVSPVRMEQELFGIDHQETGYAISVKWKFPSEFSDVMRHHHESTVGLQPSPLLKLVKAADRFSLSPDNTSDIEGHILLKEKDVIAREIETIMDMLRL